MRVPWLFPTLESLHFIGVCFLFGSLLLVDLRLLGFLRGGSAGMAFAYLWITVGAFALLLATGLCFFFTNPFNYWSNPVFKIKMVLVMLGGTQAAVFTILEHRQVLALVPDLATGPFTRTSAHPSHALWVILPFPGR